MLSLFVKIFQIKTTMKPVRPKINIHFDRDVALMERSDQTKLSSAVLQRKEDILQR